MKRVKKEIWKNTVDMKYTYFNIIYVTKYIMIQKKIIFLKWNFHFKGIFTKT